jgi:hypothetical protein
MHVWIVKRVWSLPLYVLFQSLNEIVNGDQVPCDGRVTDFVILKKVWKYDDCLPGVQVSEVLNYEARILDVAMIGLVGWVIDLLVSKRVLRHDDYSH